MSRWASGYFKLQKEKNLESRGGYMTFFAFSSPYKLILRLTTSCTHALPSFLFCVFPFSTCPALFCLYGEGWAWFLAMVSCLIVASKEIQILIPGTHVNVTLYDKRDFAAVNRLRIMRRDCLGLSGWSLNIITSVLIKERQREL